VGIVYESPQPVEITMGCGFLLLWLEEKWKKTNTFDISQVEVIH